MKTGLVNLRDEYFAASLPHGPDDDRMDTVEERLSPASRRGRPRKWEMWQILNAILMEICRDHCSVKIHTRYMRKDGGAWEGWAVWPGTNAHEKRTYYEIKLK